MRRGEKWTGNQSAPALKLVVSNSKAKELVGYRDTYQKTHRYVHCLPRIARVVNSPGVVGSLAGIGSGISIPLQLIARQETSVW
jgi:hypothetical protein